MPWTGNGGWRRDDHLPNDGDQQRTVDGRGGGHIRRAHGGSGRSLPRLASRASARASALTVECDVSSKGRRALPIHVVKRIILVVIVGGFVLVATTLGYGDPYRALRRLGLVR